MGLHQRSNICIIGVPEREKGKKNERVFEETITDNFPNLARDIKLQILESEWDANRIHTNKSTSRHIIINKFKTKDK